ncbi:uncharacterized protein LOC123525125 isoform X1 [Mercenaria mercenaria]|uniref:uncharacterized protein LOC123525125 isoform X1 n=1 Tax=Mercenaria mercenaria TaxID=6596 RepID=UPI00234ED26B|nr:uncharacterized protein LOC123525125 isoform X1 [Mercenaria mercenaria]
MDVNQGGQRNNDDEDYHTRTSHVHNHGSMHEYNAVREQGNEMPIHEHNMMRKEHKMVHTEHMQMRKTVQVGKKRTTILSVGSPPSYDTPPASAQQSIDVSSSVTTETTDTSQIPTSATSNQTSSNKPDYNEQSIEGPATPSTHTEPENGNTPVTETETSRPSLTRSPFRPVRPVQPSPQMNQTLTLLNVLTDQVRDLSKEVIESKKGQAAYNKRLTDIEATQAVIMSKLDILINQKQLQSSPVEDCASHDTEEAPDIDDQYVLSESLLRTLKT